LTSGTFSVTSLPQNLTVLLPYSFQNIKLRLDEAFTAFVSMHAECGDKLHVLTKVLPQVSLIRA
jgi:hypothetical protein